MKVGFIGCGNMGAALAKAVYISNCAEIYLTDTDIVKATTLAYETRARVSSKEEIASDCDIIFLAVKPNVITDVIADLNGNFSENKPLIISMAAGVKIKKLQNALPSGFPIIRIMPNTPVAVNSGMITYCKNELVTPSSTEDFKRIMSHGGTLDEICEELIDSATAIAGCGPAFAYMFINALCEEGVKIGLSREKALLYATKMLEGSAKMALLSSDTPSALKEKVCSPGGSTIEGVHALEDAGFESAVRSAVRASYEKTKKLG